MRSIRLAAVTALILFAGTQPAWAQCASFVQQIASRNAQYVMEAKSIVWTGSALGVISEQDPARGFFVGRFTPTGELLSRETRVPDTFGSKLVDFVWNGTEYGVFTLDSAGRLILNRLTSGGDAVGPAVHIFRDSVFTDGNGIDVVWDPDRGAYIVFAILADPSAGLWTSTVEPGGSIFGTTRVAAAASDSFVRVARTSSGTVGVFFREDASDDVSLYRRTGSIGQLIRDVWTTDTDLDVTAFDNQFALAKWRSMTNSRQELVYTLLDTSGQRAVQDLRLLIVYEREEDQKLPLTIAAGGGEIGIAYLDPNGRGQQVDSGLRLLRITQTGDILADTYFAAADSRESSASTDRDIAWTGDSWVGALERETSLGSNSYLVRLCRLEAEIDAVRFAPAGVPVLFTAVVDGGVPGFGYRWRFSDGSESSSPSTYWTSSVPGSYPVELVVTDSSGVVETATFTVTLTEGKTVRRRAVGRR